MKVTITQDNCISCGVCSGDCPEVFEEDDSGVTKSSRPTGSTAIPPWATCPMT